MDEAKAKENQVQDDKGALAGENENKQPNHKDENKQPERKSEVSSKSLKREQNRKKRWRFTYPEDMNAKELQVEVETCEIDTPKIKRPPLYVEAEGMIVNEKNHEVLLYLKRQLAETFLDDYEFITSLKEWEPKRYGFKNCKVDYKKDYIVLDFAHLHLRDQKLNEEFKQKRQRQLAIKANSHDEDEHFSDDLEISSSKLKNKLDKKKEEEVTYFDQRIANRMKVMSEDTEESLLNDFYVKIGEGQKWRDLLIESISQQHGLAIKTLNMHSADLKKIQGEIDLLQPSSRMSSDLAKPQKAKSRDQARKGDSKEIVDPGAQKKLKTQLVEKSLEDHLAEKPFFFEDKEAFIRYQDETPDWKAKEAKFLPCLRNKKKKKEDYLKFLEAGYNPVLLVDLVEDGFSLDNIEQDLIIPYSEDAQNFFETCYDWLNSVANRCTEKAKNRALSSKSNRKL